jgi:hypothetical protein
MGTIAEELVALLGGVQKVAEGAAEVEQAAERGLTRAAAVMDRLTQSDTVDRIVDRSVGALFQGVLEEAQAAAPAPRPAPSPPPRTRVRQRPPRKHG